jgi:murein L,D-transpeptidase YafK
MGLILESKGRRDFAAIGREVPPMRGTYNLFLLAATAIFVSALLLAPEQAREIRVEPRASPASAPPLPRETAGPFPKPERPAPPPQIAALEDRLTAGGFTKGDPVLIRIFKSEKVLEVWLQSGRTFSLFGTYPICTFSGPLGPKQKEGDGVSPEGFYEVTAKQLNPASRYFLSFNLGFPNAYDTAKGRTGSALMVHGGCESIGCYAMTDEQIAEIYALVEAALTAGQASVQVQAFPFRLTPENMSRAAAHPWAAFWKNLKEGYDAFEAARVPSPVFVCGGRYVFAEDKPAACEAISGW